MKIYLLRVLFTLLLISIVLTSYAQSTFSGTGNWSDGARWSNGIPSSTTLVTIAAGATCTVNGNYSCSTITYASGTSNSSVTINSGFTLTVTGTIALSNPSAPNISQEFVVGDGIVTCDGVTMVNTTDATYKNRLSIGNGQITISTTFTLGGGAIGENELVFTGSGKLIYNGSSFGLGTNDTYTRGTGTIQLGRLGAVTLPSGITYHNIILAGNNTKTITNTTINKLTINSGVTATCGNNNLTINDTLLNNGTLTIND